MEKTLIELAKILYESYPLTAALLVVLSLIIWQLYSLSRAIQNLVLLAAEQQRGQEKIKKVCCSKSCDAILTYLLDDKIPVEKFPGGTYGNKTKDDCGDRKFPLN
jgi:hypothetical protein